ncbi:hypothetical protein CRENBAI_016766 [Crenichthys baileyi]|uniref:Secreted protein n=1 Tax=Crenichthys baileyi TaxID=28760 RepID=A0AAV9SP95_9TELE
MNSCRPSSYFYPLLFQLELLSQSQPRIHTHSHAFTHRRMRTHIIRLFPLVGVATATVGEITLRMASSAPADAGQVPGFLLAFGCVFVCGNQNVTHPHVSVAHRAHTLPCL